jgi:acetyltransferase-like isoleucine patch superfamily enzyme
MNIKNSFGANVKIWSKIKCYLFIGEKVSLGNSFHIGMLSFVYASEKLKIGDDVYVGKFCSIQCNGKIGNGVLIANNVGIVGRRDHDFKKIGVLVRNAPWVGTSPDLAQDPKNSIEICDDVWIGFGSVILSGITIGRGAIVAAGAVVINDVEPYAIVSGNPAQKIAMRFTPDEIASHEAALAMNCKVK